MEINYNYRRQCFCGNETLQSRPKRPESECNTKCPGDPNKICGGEWRMNVFETEFNSNYILGLVWETLLTLFYINKKLKHNMKSLGYNYIYNCCTFP